MDIYRGSESWMVNCVLYGITGGISLKLIPPPKALYIKVNKHLLPPAILWMGSTTPEWSC
jgi:hypothetical protein